MEKSGRGRSRKAAVRGNPINVKFIATIHHLEEGKAGEKLWMMHIAE